MPSFEIYNYEPDITKKNIPSFVTELVAKKNYNDLLKIFEECNYDKKIVILESIVVLNDYNILKMCLESFGYQIVDISSVLLKSAVYCNFSSEIRIREKYETCIKYKIKKDRTEIIKYLLLYSNDQKILNACTKIAASQKNICSIKLLAEHGADIHCDDEYLFRYAAFIADLNLVKYLCEHGVDIHKDNDMILYKLAVSAIKIKLSDPNGSNMEVLKYAIDNGLDPNFNSGKLLKYCVRCNMLTMAKYLLDNGANVNLMDYKNLADMVQLGKYNFIELFDKYQMNFTILNNYVPNDYNYMDNYRNKIYELLLNKGVNKENLLMLMAGIYYFE